MHFMKWTYSMCNPLNLYGDSRIWWLVYGNEIPENDF